jgi:hypothetical protein
MFHAGPAYVFFLVFAYLLSAKNFHLPATTLTTYQKVPIMQELNYLTIYQLT